MVGDVNKYQQVAMADSLEKGTLGKGGSIVGDMAGIQMGMAMGQQMVQNMQQNMNTGNAAGAGAKFCPNCGTPTNGAKFCSNCGTKLG